MIFFDWKEAARRARAGAAVRRYGWLDRWLVNPRGKGLWWIVPHATSGDPSALPPVRVVQTEDFGLDEFFANDWTADPPEQNNPCARPDRPPFAPPAFWFDAHFIESGIRLRAGVGSGNRAGAYLLDFRHNGDRVAMRPAPAPGLYTVDVPASLSADVAHVCELVISSLLPLPPWSGYARHVLTLPPLAYDEIDLALAYPVNARPWWDTPAGRRSLWDGGQRIYGPWAEARWVYTHASDPAWADDDLILNETWINPDGVSGPVHAATTMLLFLPPGTPLSVDVNNTNAMTGCHTDGALRVYNRPL